MSLPENNRIGSGQSTSALNAADWWVRHHINIRMIGFISLALFIVLSWGYGIWTLFDAYALSYPKEQRYTARIVGTKLGPDADSVSAPIPLQIGGAMSLLPEASLQHLYAPVSNANPLWWAIVTYRFRDGDTQTPLRTAALLPNDTRILTELGWQGATMRTPSLSIESTQWKRVESLPTGTDYAAYKAQFLKFTIDKPVYASDLDIEGKKLGRTTYTFTNPTGYSYRTVELLTTLYRDGAIVGINKLVLPSVAAGSSQPINIVWPDNPIGVTRVDVQPFVNILDPETFKTTDSTGF